MENQEVKLQITIRSGDERGEMTPLEINKKIADLKGVFQDLAPDVIYINWAENISDAWELFEEIEAPFISVYAKDGKRIYHAQFMGCEGIAENAPLAICKAWLEWKGVEI